MSKMTIIRINKSNNSPRSMQKRIKGTKQLGSVNDIYITLLHIINMNIPQLDLQDLVAEDPKRMYNRAQKRDEWKETYQLIDFTIPEVIQSSRIKKKFKVQLWVKDTNNDTIFSKTLFFGQDDDYVFTNNQSSRLRKLASLKHSQNPLHQDYWRTIVCLRSPSLRQNLQKLADYLIQGRLRILENGITSKKIHSTFPIKKKNQ